MTKNEQKIRQTLNDRRAELIALEKATTDDRRPVELDQTRVGRLSRMDALQGQAMALETERRRRQEIQKIEAAIGRLDSGDYGYCVSCGEEIEAARLKIDPAIPICLSCAKR